MSAITAPRTARRGAVSAAYAAQGLGYATVVTALPALKDRVGIDDATVSVLLLGTCLAAAAGSVLADVVAIRRGSRMALVAGLVTQALGLLVIAATGSFEVLLVAVVVYGVGLGAVDASSNMQGALLQRQRPTPVFGRLYAAYTAAAILATLGTAMVLGAAVPATLTLAVTAVVQAAVAIWGLMAFDPARAAHRVHDEPRGRVPLPRRAIWAVGAIVFAAFVIDSAVSSWSTIYLSEGLDAAPGLTPLGYAAYLAAMLLARLSADPAVRTLGPMRVGVAAILLAVAGAVLVAVWPTVPTAIIGFAAMGAASGALVPLAFARAGELLPARSDEVIARVNLFNYGGAVAGAVVLGLVATGPQLGVAFLIPAAVLAGVLPILRTLRR
jgi:MFS family permease